MPGRIFPCSGTGHSPRGRDSMIALAMIAIMLSRPRGLWPVPEHGKIRPGTPSADPAPVTSLS